MKQIKTKQCEGVCFVYLSTVFSCRVTLIFIIANYIIITKCIILTRISLASWLYDCILLFAFLLYNFMNKIGA